MDKEPALQRGLKNRHIQMIALGGAIGTGLFYGSAEAIRLAGPATVLSYFFGGVIIYFIMRMLGEMAAEEPVAGGFSYFAYHYCNPFAGFVSGWNYWFLYVLVSMAELTVIGSYVHHWIAVDHWIPALIVLVLVTTFNLFHVRAFGEFEFWFALVKILAVCGMIVFGLVLIISGWGGSDVAISNLWSHGGFFPMGISGVLLGLVVVMFSFGGIELIGIAAGEAENPKTSIPRAIKQVMWRILLFYVGAITVIMIVMPWDTITPNISPFVLIFERVGVPFAGHLLNLVVLTAAISVYNSGIYSNGRMLFSLAVQGNAPKIFTSLGKRKTPYLAILFSSACTLLAVIINYLVPEGAFMKVMAGAMSAAVMTWMTIVIVHFFFRRVHKERRTKLVFAAPFYPFANYLCMAFLIGLILSMLATGFRDGGAMIGLLKMIGLWGNNQAAPISLDVPDMSVAALIIPVWFCVLLIGYRIKTILDKKKAG